MKEVDPEYFADDGTYIPPDDMLVCENCSMVFSVTWINDGGGPPVDYCPRCGVEMGEE